MTEAAGTGTGAEGTGAGEEGAGAELGAVRGWARYYVGALGWSVAPAWLPAPGGPEEGCRCPAGADCPRPGKHLVDGGRVVRPGPGAAEAVDEAFGPDAGIAVLCGSESALLVWDLPPGAAVPPGWAGEGSLVAVTPSGGRHWFFRLEEGEALGTGGGAGVGGGTVLADGAYAVVGPREGYWWEGGRDAVAAGAGALSGVPEGMRVVLRNRGMLLHGVEDIHQDDPWRCEAGAGLVGSVGRTLSRTGDVRRLVDGWGAGIRWTPGRGWSAWTAGGWVSGEAAEMEIARLVQDGLVGAVRREAVAAREDGRDADAGRAMAWAARMSGRAGSWIIGELKADPRVQVADEGEWDKDGGICGLPVVDGVGRVIRLADGRVSVGARERLVSKVLGCSPVAGGGGGVLAAAGGAGGAGAGSAGGGVGGRGAVAKYLADLEGVHGPDFMRLLQRAAGASLYGGGELDRMGVGSDMVFVLGGAPRSGKSTFVETLSAVMGGYARAINPNLLFGDRGNPEFVVAGIRGARMLHMSEPPSGAVLNVPMLKALSGGDSLTGRGAYQRGEVSFRPDATVWIATNHHLEHTDEALWERLKIFEFRSDYAGGKGSAWVREQMRGSAAERAAFLRWALDGARALASEGWGDTSLWDDAVRRTKSDMDPLAAFCEQALVVGAGGEVSAASVLLALDRWLLMADEALPGKPSRQAVREELVYRITRAGGTWDPYRKVYRGVRLS
jgi:hypothetical protein